jgi:aminopeptidase
MDSRVQNHAETIINHSAEIQDNDHVVIDAHPVTEDLVTTLCRELAEQGARPIVIQERAGKRFTRAYLCNHERSFEHPKHILALYEEMDAYILIRGSNNVTETSDIDPAVRAEFEEANQPLLNERLDKKWCLTQYPAPANAQLAQMSTEGYEDFVWNAIDKDWDAVKKYQSQLAEILESAETVRIVSGEQTDIQMSIAGNEPANDYGKRNLPGGEVFTAPVRESVEGTVLFDKPLYHQGREVSGVYLEFEQGEIVHFSADKNEEALKEVITTDEGAKFLGELGFGMNRDIKEFSYNMLFDEKMGDTVHMAVGRAYERNIGPNNDQNKSAVHVDMIIDMSEDSQVMIDGEVIQRDGKFVFENEFSG